MVLHYTPIRSRRTKADAGCRKLVGKTFTCSVRHYKVRKAKREKGKIVDENGQIEMRVVWEDAPSDYKVKGKSIVGAEMDFTLQKFKESYTVYKREKPIVVV